MNDDKTDTTATISTSACIGLPLWFWLLGKPLPERWYLMA